MGIIRYYEEPFIEQVAAGYFRIDDQGRVWKLWDFRNGHKGPCEPRRAERGPSGCYQQVRFKLGGRFRYVSAHRAVYRYLKGPIPKDAEVNHDNGLKDDNRPDNLIATTPGQNAKHAHRSGLKDQYGQKNPGHKLKDNQVAQIRLAYSKGGHTMEELGRRFGVAFQHISRIVRGAVRPKQGGPVAGVDLRHNACDRDEVTGRFVSRDMPVAGGAR